MPTKNDVRSFKEIRKIDVVLVGGKNASLRMIRSDRAASGAIFTLDTEYGFHDVVFVNGAYGLSDFKTNEYARLLGGVQFEPKEENPMLCFRGASRYAYPAYAARFALECATMRRLRTQMGLTTCSR
jgi:phosphoenolpyruvate synthase/pyruvate phosphate dikinase